jgi:hypothetical protein
LPIDGPAFGAELKSVNDWQIEFNASGAARKLPATDLVAWGAFREPGSGSQIFLASGGLLVADVITLDKDTLQCEGDALGAVRLPLEAVAGILWHPPLERARRDQLTSQIRSASGEADRVLLDNGDELTGAIAGLKSDSLKLDMAAGPASAEVNHITAVIFNPSLAARPQPRGLRAMLGFADGSRLLATQFSLKNGDIELELAGVGPARSAGERIVALQPLGGKAVYLSDLKPAAYKHIPYLQLNWPLAVDASVNGGPLRYGGKLYLKGLGMHSAARVTYDLDGSYRFLRSELAIDDSAGPGGSVDFRVFVDTGDGRWQARYASPAQRGGQPSTPMSVDLVGAKRISLLVEFADRGDQHDDADWLNARLIK